MHKCFEWLRCADWGWNGGLRYQILPHIGRSIVLQHSTLHTSTLLDSMYCGLPVTDARLIGMGLKQEVEWMLCMP